MEKRGVNECVIEIMEVKCWWLWLEEWDLGVGLEVWGRDGLGV